MFIINKLSQQTLTVEIKVVVTANEFARNRGRYTLQTNASNLS